MLDIILIFPSPFQVKKGEEITGCFSMKPNQRNNRDLDFNIEIDFKGELCTVLENNHYRMRWAHPPLPAMRLTNPAPRSRPPNYPLTTLSVSHLHRLVFYDCRNVREDKFYTTLA